MSTMPFRFGYKASSEQFAPRELLDYGVLAEQAGFESVFISDHLQPWKHTDGHAPAAIAWLGALGARTEKILMGTSVLTPTFRHHPAMVAQAFGTLGQLFPGRVILGVGTGESLNEAPLGFEWPDIKERFARLKEAVLLIERLWAEERVTHEGTYYRTDNVTIYDRPEVKVPIYIGASALPPPSLPVASPTATSPPRASRATSTPTYCSPPSGRGSTYRAAPATRSTLSSR